MESAKSPIPKKARYAVIQNVLLFNQSSFAELIDIDETGATCRTLMDVDGVTNLNMDIELLNCDDGLHLKGISCRLIPNSQEKSFSNGVYEETCSLEFPELSHQKRVELKKFIERSCRRIQAVSEAMH